MSDMEETLKETLGVDRLERLETRGGGYMSQTLSYLTDNGKVFVKVNAEREARRMFEGEQAGLKSILSTGIVRCPTPIKILDHPTKPGSIFIMEHIELLDLDEHAATLGEQVANLHLYNSHLKAREEREEGWIGFHCHTESENELGDRYVPQFGFHETTCCGYLPLDNTWSADWLAFYAQQRLKPQIDLIERNHGDRDVMELWSQLVLKIPRILGGLGPITPALLHGDLHGGNVAESDTGPVIYDPACFYGHNEYDLAVTGMFVDFNPAFHLAYHNVIPKAPRFEERQKLYQLFCYLNHWNHLGSMYKGRILSIMRELTGHVPGKST